MTEIQNKNTGSLGSTRPGGSKGGSSRVVKFLVTGNLAGENTSLGGLLEAAWFWRYLTLGLMALGLLAATSYILLASKKYTATARLLIETRNPKILSTFDILPSIGKDSAQIDSQLVLLRSSDTARRVIEQLGLDRKLRLSPKAEHSELQNGPKTKRKVRQSTIDKLLKRLTVQRKGLSYIVLVNYTDEEPARAAIIASAIARSYVGHQLKSKRDATKHASSWLKNRITELRKQVRNSEENVVEFRRKHKLTTIGGMTIDEHQLIQTVKQQSEAVHEVSVARSKVDQIKRLASQPDRLNALGKALQSGVITSLRSQYAIANRKQISLISQYGRDHQRVEAVQAEIEDINRTISLEVSRLVKNATNNYDVAISRLDLLTKRLDKLRERYSIHQKTMVELGEFERQAEANRKIYLSYLTRFNETRSQDSLQIADVRMLAKAAIPRRPTSPRRGLILAIAGISSLGLGLFLSVMFTQFNQTIRKLSDAVTVLRSPHVASLPKIDVVQAQKPRLSGLPFPFSLLAGKQANVRHHMPYCHILENPQSKFTQHIFTITNILEPLHEKYDAKVISTVSGKSGEGKTMVAQNLAYYLAVAGHKTLLIDCDLRKRDLTKMMMKDEPLATLVDYVNGDARAGEVIVSDEETGFYFCPGSGSDVPVRPMNILASSQIRKFIEKQRSQFDYIILDSYAILDNVDSLPLIPISDILLWVMEWNVTTVDQLALATKKARVREDQLVVAVLNKTA